MTYEDLIAELVERRALIVHCSRPGKSGDDGPLFPEDLRKAIEIVGNGTGAVSCSVVWPSHQKTYGAVGIVLRPRTTSSVTSLKSIDAGTRWDPAAGERTGDGAPFSAEAVADTFDNPTGYNEWVVRDADCLGIFVNLQEPLEVARRVEPKDLEGYDESMIDCGPVVCAGPIRPDEIRSEFPGLPIFVCHNGAILDDGGIPASPYGIQAAAPPCDDRDRAER